MDVWQSLAQQNTGGMMQAPVSTYSPTAVSSFSLPGAAFYPKLKPASQRIGEDLSQTFAPIGQGPGIMSRLTNAGGAVLDAFGLPQEAATRVLTGNQYAVPSDVPAVKNFFGDTPLGGMAADVLLDPMNLLMIPGASEVLKGMTMGRDLAGEASSIREMLNISRKGYASNSPKDLQRILESAGDGWGHLPTVFDDTSKMWKLDVGQISPTIRDQALSDIDAVINGDQFYKTKPTAFGAGQDPAKPGFWKSLQIMFGTPDQVSPLSRTVMDQFADARKARSMFNDTMDERLYGVLHDTPIWNNPKDPLGRALSYDIMARQPGEWFAKDPQAAAAIGQYGQDLYEAKKAGVQKIIGDMYQKIPTRWVDDAAIMRGDPSETIGTVVDRALETGKSIPNLPEVNQWRSGIANKDPNTVNWMDSWNLFKSSIGKDAFTRPAAEAVEGLIGKYQDGKWVSGSAQGIDRSEAEMLDMVKRQAMGQPNLTDFAAMAAINGNKDWLRSMAYGNDLAELAANGEKVNPEGWRSQFADLVDKSIGAAQGKNYIYKNLETGGRNLIFNAMMGGAVDTAFKFLGEQLNNVARFGIGPSLQAAGAYLTPEWKEYLSTRNIVDRSNTLFNQLLESKLGEGMAAGKPAGLADKVYDWLGSPMRAVDNFNRGTAFIAAVKHYTSGADLATGALKMADALPLAEDAVKQLHFGYEATDISPVWNQPFLRPLAQFMTWPMKQAEYLASAYKNGTGLNNELLRYIMNQGFALGAGANLGLDVKKMFWDGIAGPSGPLYQAIGNAKDVAESSINTLMGQGDPSESPAKFWKGMGQLILNTAVPGGRYAGKITKNILESGRADLGTNILGNYDPIQIMMGDNYDLKRSLAQHPAMQPFVDALNIHPDPGVDPYDRVASLIGLSTTHADARKDFLDFLKNFSQRYRDAKSNIDSVAVGGGDVSQALQRNVDYLQNTFHEQFAKYRVPEAPILQMLRPSTNPQALQEMRRAAAAPAEARAVQSAPAPIRPFLIPTGGIVNPMKPGGFR